MDALILLFSFLALMFLGIPVAYAMGLATLVTALWIDLPLEAIMLKISDGMDDFALLTILFCVERLWLGQPPADSYAFRDQPQTE